MLGQLRDLAPLSPSEVETAFAVAAREILLGSQLVVGDDACHVLEVEFYFHGPNHPDPFAHQHAIQSLFGRWYFHRVGTGYRGGSFKGVDVTFGDDGCFGGMLLRTLESPDEVICGPSLCVDYMLARTGFAKPEQLDAEIQSRDAWDVSSPLHFEHKEQNDKTMFRCARVGLSTKGLSTSDHPDEFINKHYRFLAEPRKIKKGRAELIRGLAAAKYSLEEIHELTGSPRKTIQRHAF